MPKASIVRDENVLFFVRWDSMTDIQVYISSELLSIYNERRPHRVWTNRSFNVMPRGCIGRHYYCIYQFGFCYQSVFDQPELFSVGAKSSPKILIQSFLANPSCRRQVRWSIVKNSSRWRLDLKCKTTTTTTNKCIKRLHRTRQA